jgi:hypothetical protein
MKGPLGFNADDLMQETLAMQRKLMEGLKLLPQVEDVDYGVTAREEVWRDGKVVLYRFVGEQAPTRRTPLLIVYALVNRPYMVDLQADRSLVQKLLALGQDVYVLDWGYPDRSERFQTLEDYLLRYIDGAVDALRAQWWPGRPARHLPGRRVRAVLRRAAPAEAGQADHHGHPGRFPDRRQHALALGAAGGRGPAGRHAGQHPGRPDECQLPDAQAVPPERAEVRRPARHPR